MGGLGGQFPKNLNWSEKTTTTQKKKLWNLLFRWRKEKRKFPYANDLKYWDDFNITQLGGAASQPTMIRIMNGAQTFALLAFTSKQKSALKWTIIWVHIITSRIISYCNINANLNDNTGSDRSKLVFLKSLDLSFIFLQALRGFLGYRCAYRCIYHRFLTKEQWQVK